MVVGCLRTCCGIPPQEVDVRQHFCGGSVDSSTMLREKKVRDTSTENNEYVILPIFLSHSAVC